MLKFLRDSDPRKTWVAQARIGVFWNGPRYRLCYGWLPFVWLRSRLHLIRYPYRTVRIRHTLARA